MIYTFLVFFIYSLLFGQILPTIPGNVFRVTIGTDINHSSFENYKWKIGRQNFNLDEMKDNLMDAFLTSLIDFFGCLIVFFDCLLINALSCFSPKIKLSIRESLLLEHSPWLEQCLKSLL